MPDGRLRCVASLPFSLVVPSCSRNLSSFGTELHDAMRIALDDVDVAFPVDAARMLPRRVDRLAVDLLIGAGQDQVAVGVEHHHRLGAAIEDVDAILLHRSPGRRCPADSSGRRRLPLAAARAVRRPRGAPRGRLRLALGRRRRRLLSPKIHAGRQLRPVRHEPVAAIALRSTVRHQERKDRTRPQSFFS